MNKTITARAETITAEIMQLFEQFGKEDYDGEPVSQTSHMIQCAMKAMENDGDAELILGALLHDLGHLLKHKEATEAMGAYGVKNHEGLGAAFLRERGFSERICAMVEMHVQAKRFLVAQVPEYRAKLSEASLQTLSYQGGPMTAEEALRFREQPFFNDIIKVRMWDEEAKDSNAFLLPLTHFRTLMLDYLSDQNL